MKPQPAPDRATGRAAYDLLTGEVRGIQQQIAVATAQLATTHQAAGAALARLLACLPATMEEPIHG